jgi:cyclic pyranopterin monophosphate synthase
VSDERRLSHVGDSGEARMVDVSAKGDTARLARASGVIRMRAETLEAIRANQVKKGDVLAVARIAGIMAAKRTSDLVPLCHPIPLHDIQIAFFTNSDLPGIRAESVAKTIGKTGVEMEALTAVAVALLTIYDMAKAIDREMVIADISLDEKSGGVSGGWSRG